MSTDAEQPTTGQADAGEVAEPTEEQIEKAKENVAGLAEKYETGARKTVAVPGTDGTVAGTAFEEHVNDMSDEDKEKAEKEMEDFKAEQEERQKERDAELEKAKDSEDSTDSDSDEADNSEEDAKS